jgi:hypothetical protein
VPTCGRAQVEQGEDVPVDLVVSESEAEVLPWVGAASSVRRRVGDPVVAGAHVLRGRLIGTCTWAGVDRVFARLVIDPRRRIDVLDPVARAARSLVERWTALASLGAALLAFAISRSWLDAAMTAVVLARDERHRLAARHPCRARFDAPRSGAASLTRARMPRPRLHPWPCSCARDAAAGRARGRYRADFTADRCWRGCGCRRDDPDGTAIL